MILRLVRWLALKLPCRIITGEDEKPYLARFRVFGWMPGDARRWPCSVYLHRFFLPDLDDALRNHPWSWAFSLVLTGGYTEENDPGGARWHLRMHYRGPGSWRVLRATSYHRVHELHGETWTLFIVGPKTKSWGFYVPGRGHVPWRERLAERGIEAPYA